MFNEELCKVSERINANCLTVNTDKMLYVNFSNRTIPESDTFIKLNNVSLSYSRALKYLSVILDESINFKEHVLMTSDKISKNIGILQSFSAYSLKNLLIKLYYALVCLYLTYCNSIRGTANETNLKKILIL